MPMKQRVPKLKGFNNPFRVEYQPVNLDTLAEIAERLDDGVVTPERLVEHGAARKGSFVKILARGELTAKLDVRVHAVSKAAEAAITAAGGTVTIVTLPFREDGRAGRPPAKGNQFANR
jgi:large subunit ribosomal protein L15